VLYQLLGDIVQEGRRFASAADVKASDINGEAPVGTTLAVLEREMKVMSAVQARVHAAVSRELGILTEIVRDYGPGAYPYDLEDGQVMIEDFDDRVDIIPVSDPNAGTMAQRIMQYQAALQLAAQAPQMYDIPMLHRQMLEVLGIQDADKLVPTENDIKPTDPVSENMNIINGEPVKAFIYQDHEAHIQVHMSMMENPQLMAIASQSPNAQAAQAAMAAHVSAHVAFEYRRQIERELGVELPPQDEPLPEDIEYRLSKLVAPAAAQLTGKAQQQAQAEQNAQMQQDPVIQMQERELALKEQQALAKVESDQRSLDIKEQQAGVKAEVDIAKSQAEMAKIQADLEKAREKTALDYEKMEQEERLEAAKIAAKMQSQQDTMSAQAEMEGFRSGFSLVKDLIDDE
jgi:hypothetical protein